MKELRLKGALDRSRIQNVCIKAGSIGNQGPLNAYLCRVTFPIPQTKQIRTRIRSFLSLYLQEPAQHCFASFELLVR